MPGIRGDMPVICQQQKILIYIRQSLHHAPKNAATHCSGGISFDTDDPGILNSSFHLLKRRKIHTLFGKLPLAVCIN